ncbi:MAG: tRNA lysidine(34) synthetase TilS [Muribaculaceae bacterium]|nr:tRNA lysidine(34) synthetase TilS [Muribaculaceae bacterium]
MKEIVRKIENSVHGFLKTGNIRSVLVAVSGGADSVALLCACARIATRYSIHVEAVNCNFHLRGTESDRDSSFTADLCRRLGIRLHQLEYDVNAYLKGHPGISTEMACRELRYSDFFRIAKERDLDRIAVAHNSDDDIETMLLNMLRGSGTRGLRGMDVDNGRLIRPLLCVSRADIEAYLEAIRQDYITDSSNLTSDYRRNYIRRDVLPLLESRWPGARKTLNKTLSIIKEESGIIEDFYNRELARLCPDKETMLIYSEGVNTGIILRFIEPYGGNSDIANGIRKCLDKEFKERTWQLSERYEAVLERDRLIIFDNEKDEEDPKFLWTKIEINPETIANVKNNRGQDIAFLPYGESEYVIRRPAIGDRIAPLGMRGTRLVSDIISDAKLDRKTKSRIRVLVRKSDSEIIWISGLKRSRHDLIRLDSESCFKLESVN